ncbi:MAG: hypothetical protein JWN85_367 [Gammaproteobacteria bacterium]|nr:hypothetical protein [Gammaproteobacteria bacterium]
MKVFFTACLLLLTAPVSAQQTASPLSSIRVTGDSLVSAKPDRVQIDIGVLTQAAQSQTAAAQNATRLEAALTALRKAVGPGADIKTVSYSLNPDYQYHPNGGEPTITGYTATNVVRVTLGDLAKIGSIIDTATQAGANRVEGIQFTLSDEQSVRSQALREAAQKARADADVLAGALGLKVVRILQVEENGSAGPVRPVMFEARAMAAKAPTPIQPGSIDVGATVVLTVEVIATAR